MTKQIDFMGKRKIAVFLSAALLIASIVSLAVNGLQLGLDFTGGTLVEVEYSQAPDLEEVRQQLNTAGYEKLVVQNFGADTSVLVRLSQGFSDKVGAEVTAALAATGESLELKRAEFVGAQVGEELREQGGLGLLLALAIVMLYVAIRFSVQVLCRCSRCAYSRCYYCVGLVLDASLGFRFDGVSRTACRHWLLSQRYDRGVQIGYARIFV